MVQTPQNYLPNGYMQPQVNAVKIDIINPQANGSMPNVAQQPAQNYTYPQPNYIYNYPTAPVYEMPTQSSYYPQPPIINQQNIPQQYLPPMTPPMPLPPPPSVIEQQPVPQTVQTQPPVQAPPQPLPPAQVSTPSVDIQSINNGLKSANLDEQTAAIQKIAEIGETNPQQAQALLNEETFKGLVDIIIKDNSQLQGPSKDSKELSQKEKAEMNKQYGTYTLAVLQKLFRESFDIEAKKQGVPTNLTINELPGIVPIVENVKSNPNPVIREASISALSYIARPEDKPVIETIFKIASEQDSDPMVKQAATQALTALPK
jgi:hypothetical protein